MTARIVLGHARWLAPGKLRWARALIWLLGLAALCILVFNVAADSILRLSALVAGETFTSRADSPAVARLLAVIVGSLAMLGAYALAVHFVERRPAEELALGRLLPDLAGGLALGGLLIALIIGVLWSAGWVTIESVPATHIAESIKQSIQSGVIEEVVMRLILFRLLWRAAGVLPALLLTGALFGALHLTNPEATIFAGLCLLAGEGIGAGLYMLTGRIWASVGMHAGWNFAQGWLFGSAVSGLDFFAGGPLQTRPVEGFSDMLSGGEFGPEASLAALAVSLAASMICLGLAWKKGAFVAADR
ncbi:MAG: CPBP family intramembrane glutamic endopeptidase [Terricaulis sp.]